MTTDIHTALGELLSVQRLHVHITPTVGYRVTAPCRLAQLYDAVGASTGSGSGGPSGGAALLVSADALDLWRDIATAASMWAVAVGVDRSRYLKRATQPRPPAAAVFATVDTPPVGRLLRAAATEADRRGLDAMVATIGRLSRTWAGRIDGLFGAPESKAIRGVPCPDCGATYVMEERDGERFRVSALALSYGWADSVRAPYRWCRACGSWAWLDIDESEAA